jgi:hypothetical protein
MTIAAIPTTYRDIRFRSRLEARWAAFFDQVGLSWSYEPIDCPGWIPDFRVGELLVDVKPARERPAAAYEKIERAGARGAVIAEAPQRFAPIPFLRLIGWGGPGLYYVIGYTGRATFALLEQIGVGEGLGAAVWPWPYANRLDSGDLIDRAWAMACNLTQWRRPT